MYDSPRYPTDPEEAERFVAGQRHGTLIAAPAGGHPQVSLLPFVKTGDSIEVHCVQADPTFSAVRANPDVTFVVSDFLAFSPHHWVDQVMASRATLHFRAVAYEGEATVSTDPSAVAETLSRLLAAYEPEASYAPVVDGPLYGESLRQLAAVRIAVRSTRAKLKLGPYGSDAAKWAVVRHLRGRAGPNDGRAADVIAASLLPDGGRGGEPEQVDDPRRGKRA
ncbi:MAG: pyridoxamine 5'-phosphate oxidase family protein [Acidimicrobiales bacterium]